MTALTIRGATVDDAAGVAAVYAPSVASTPISFEMTPPTVQEMAARLASILSYAPWLVCVAGREIVGFAYVCRHRERLAYQWSLDCAVYVRGDHQRRGVGRALYTTLFALAWLQGYYAVHAGITLPNPASVALHEVMGFQRVGVYPAVGYKLGAWRDVGWWQLELRQRLAEPAVPILPDAARSAEPQQWSAAFAAGEELLR